VAANADLTGVTVAGRTVVRARGNVLQMNTVLSGDNGLTGAPTTDVLPVSELIVTLREPDAALTDLPGGTVVRRSPYGRFAIVAAAESITPLLLTTLAERNLVTTVEASYPVQLFERQAPQTASGPDDDRFKDQWGLHRIHIDQLWKATSRSRVIVAVIDTGLDVTHRDFIGNLWQNQRETLGNNKDDDHNGCIDDQFGCDFTNAGTLGIPLRDDPQGHGTHVAGIIGARGNNGELIAGTVWEASIMGIRVFDKSGLAAPDRVATAIDYAVENGARIINCSFGTAKPTKALTDAVARALAANVLIVAAAGNTDTGLPPDNDAVPVYPASTQHDGVIAVMASTRSDAKQAESRYGRTTVHIAAPGEDILSLHPGGGTRTRSGTSMATPLVSGVAALVLELQPNYGAGAVAKELVERSRLVTALSGLSRYGSILDAAFPRRQHTTTSTPATPVAPTPSPAPVNPPSQGRTVSLRGRVIAGLVAIGAETTGFGLATDSGTIELAPATPDIAKQLTAFDGETVTVSGITEQRTSLERGSREVIRVMEVQRR
jgi:subtilisin family serine protease